MVSTPTEIPPTDGVSDSGVDIFANNTIFTSEAVDKARARFKAQLGTLKDDWSMDQIDGYRPVPGVVPVHSDSGIRNLVTAKFLKDAREYLKATADLLEDRAMPSRRTRRAGRARPSTPMRPGQRAPASAPAHSVDIRYQHLGQHRCDIATRRNNWKLQRHLAAGRHQRRHYSKCGVNQWGGRADGRGADRAC